MLKNRITGEKMKMEVLDLLPRMRYSKRSDWGDKEEEHSSQSQESHLSS